MHCQIRGSNVLELVVGEHISLEGKPRTAVNASAERGFRSMQIFASSPGAWRPPKADPVRAAVLVQSCGEREIRPLFIHAIYLINLASSSPDLVQRSKQSLIETLLAGADLGAAGVITHIGSHAGRGFDVVAEQIAEGLIEVLAATPVGVELILENCAGQGGIVGSQPAELGRLIDLAERPRRLRVALDTAHACGAGWDFTQQGTAEKLVDEVDRYIGLDRVAAIHANDSLQPPGSHRDRHANIGEGHIGLSGFRNLLAQSALHHLPWILETPKLERRQDDLHALQAAFRPISENGVPSDT